MIKKTRIAQLDAIRLWNPGGFRSRRFLQFLLSEDDETRIGYV